ncbi:hypothetical protein HZB03_00735, partial [Candidatus Woesearchaeota archaeon]|nr:hypothetical protein [Candidatus Woesearchaeota archaeon]
VPAQSPPPPFCERWNFYKSADRGDAPSGDVGHHGIQYTSRAWRGGD